MFVALVTCWLCHWCPAPCVAHVPPVSIGAPAPEAVRDPVPNVPPRPRPQLPDAIVVSELDIVRPSLAACVRRARTRDPNLGVVKIELHLDIAADGTVTDATLALDDALLQRCILSVARGLRFPAPGTPAAAAIAFFAS